jgi:hypothetical protein
MNFSGATPESVLWHGPQYNYLKVSLTAVFVATYKDYGAFTRQCLMREAVFGERKIQGLTPLIQRY